MKKFLVYITVLAAIVAAGCTDFGDVDQLKLAAAPDAGITDVVPVAEGVSFTVAPLKAAGYYAWLVVESDEAEEIAADRILKQSATGVAKGIALYKDIADTTVVVEKLTAFTVYHIYAVAATEDGVLSKVTVESFRTLDDGNKPTPQTTVEQQDTTVTIAFHEPILKGTGRVYVSYFAVNTLEGDANSLAIKAGYESFNALNVAIPHENVSVDGKSLVLELPYSIPGAYASVTYDAGAVTDLEGNACNAFASKINRLEDGVPKGGITVRVPTKAWTLLGEFEEINPDTLAGFSDWEDFYAQALPTEGVIPLKTVASKKPTVVYNEPTRTVEAIIDTWGLMSRVPTFFLPEEPAFGAIVDFKIPEGAFEDAYGNINEALEVKDNYIYSYGYTLEDVIGIYDVDMVSYWDGPMPTETGITIEKDTESDLLAIKGLFASGTVVYGEFDPVRGAIVLDDEQYLATANFGANGAKDVYFVDADEIGFVTFKVPAPGVIKTDDSQWWGFYIDGLGWYDVFIESTWTRTGALPEPAPAPQKVKSVQDYLNLSSSSIKQKGRVIKR